MMNHAETTGQPEVDFLLIGAQKSGTTSLWHHIAAHPATFVPATKEVEILQRRPAVREGNRLVLANVL